MIDRRTVLAGTVAFLGMPFSAQAHRAQKVARIGVLSFGASEPFRRGFSRALLDREYVEGHNVVTEYRWASSRTDRLPALAAELIRANVDVIVANATPSIQAAMEATRQIPIVMAAAGDALRTGLVNDLARPGGNVTGLSLALIELAGKTVALLREAMPRLTRIACVGHGEDPLHREFLAEAESAARRLGLYFRRATLRGVDELDAAFGSMVQDGVSGVIVQPIFTVDPQVSARLVRLTLKHRLATVSGLRRFAGSGRARRLCLGIP